MKILVTGGAGYIGSHTIVDLVEQGFEVVSADNFLRASPKQLEGVAAIVGKPIKNYAIDICDKQALYTLFETEKNIAAIIHFAALKSVGESVHEPSLYYTNNIQSLVNVLDAAADFGVKNVIFSSSCSVYGNTTELPVTEETPLQRAESPYGHTKQIGEDMIRHYAKKYTHINYILLRYFNPAGAHGSAKIGEVSFGRPIYLTPVIMEVAMGRMPVLNVFGTTYPTRDGSCVRDFIHILDLADAHTKCLQYLQKQENETNCEVFNVGAGAGVTVLEAIKAFEKATKQPLNTNFSPPRAGDVVAIYSDYSKAKTKLGWQPQYTIEDIMKTAWQWEQTHNKLAE